MTPTAEQTSQLPQSKTWNPGFVVTLVACLLGGLVGGVIVRQAHPLFAYEDLPEIGLGAPPELVQQHHDAAFAYRSHNYGAELAIVGLALGMAFGAVSASSKRLPGILVGGVSGAAVGGLLGYFGGKIVGEAMFQSSAQTLQTSLGLHAIVWGLMLASIVWSVAAVHVGVVRAANYGVVGLFAGVGVAVTQFVISSFMFPVSNPLFLIPEQASERTYWLLAFPVVTGLILAFGLVPRRSATKSQVAG